METENMEQETSHVDIEAKLLEQFSSMGTTDREVLTAEFQRLLGNRIIPGTCEFYLEMNNWNLQAAICSYLDYEQPNQLFCSITQVISDTNDDSLPPGITVSKSFWLKNTGSEKWPPGCCLRYVHGDRLSCSERITVDPLEPSQMVCVVISLTSPNLAGTYTCQWQMSSPTGIFFGDRVNVRISVNSEDMVQLLENMSNLSSNNHHPLPGDPLRLTSDQLQTQGKVHQSPTNQCITPNLLPMTACVETVPATSLTSMSINDNDMVISSQNSSSKIFSQIAQNDVAHTQPTNEPDDIDMVT